MRKRILISISMLLLPWWLWAQTGSNTFPVDEIQAGMKGKGLSVFKGTEIEEFDVEILGVLRNQAGAQRNIILAKLSGQDLENTGMPQGMSGSPVYIDGRLVGAVAFGWAFSKEPIAGITPINEMMAIEDRQAPRFCLSCQVHKYSTN